MRTAIRDAGSGSSGPDLGGGVVTSLVTMLLSGGSVSTGGFKQVLISSKKPSRLTYSNCIPSFCVAYTCIGIRISNPMALLVDDHICVKRTELHMANPKKRLSMNTTSLSDFSY